MSRDNRSSLSLPATSSRLGNVLYSTHIPPSFSLSPSTTILAAQYISKVRELQCASSHEIYGLRRLGASFFFVSFQVKWNELTVYFIITKHSKKQKMKWGRLERGRETAMRLRDKRQHDVPSRSFSFFNILFVKSVIWFGFFGYKWREFYKPPAESCAIYWQTSSLMCRGRKKIQTK